MSNALMLNPVVVVPVHKQQPTADEEFSLLRCGKVLGSHPIRLVHPNGLNIQAYRDILPMSKPIPVPAFWMENIHAYNQMLINPSFYQKIASYSHVLIHEPDAIVISDQLLYWCKSPFHYIGAPWFDGFDNATQESTITGVGNSGFSLINISAISTAFASNSRWISRLVIAKELINILLRRRNHYSLKTLLKATGPKGLLRKGHQIFEENCDVFISHHIPNSRNTKFIIADSNNALLFSWEVNPANCAKLTQGRLPFGIHAWAKYDRPFIETLLKQSP